MASPTQWTWVWASSGRWWRSGKPGMLQTMGPQSWTWLSNWTATTCWPGRKVSLQIRKNYDLYLFTLLIFIVVFQSLVMSDSLQSHELQHDKLPWHSLSPRVCSNSCPLSWWCYTTISSSAAAFSFDLPSFPASESFHWVGFSHQVVKVLKLQHQFYEYSGLVFFRIDWFYLLGVQRTLKSPLQHHRLTASILQHSAFFMVQLPCPYMTTGKTITDYYGPLSAKWCHCAFLS